MTASLSKSAAPLARALRAALIVAALSVPAAWAADIANPPAPLPVDQAFPISASLVGGRLALKVDVLPGHYLYRDRFEFQLGERDVTAVVRSRMTKGKIKDDPNFGKVAVYEQPLQIAFKGKVEPASLTVVFQGCSEVAGVCYPPATRVFALTDGSKDIKPQEPAIGSLKEQFRKQVSQ